MFNYTSIDQIQHEAEGLGVNIPFTQDISVLGKSIDISGKHCANRLAVQPMEGCDGNADGTPGELTIRRYDRFAEGGSGLIWFEATAVYEEARANPRQLWLTEQSADDFKRIVARIKEKCERANGFEPIVIMQATHSGRYSKPHGVPAPLIAYNNPIFEKDKPIPTDRIVSDEYLYRLTEANGKMAALAEQCGFDGVDIKSCHRYLGSELLSAFTRPGRYGGSFENRTRYLVTSAKNAKQNTSKDFIVTSRLNAYDGFPYPYGFGAKQDAANAADGYTLEHSRIEPDLSEAKQLIKILVEECGFELLDITIGNPYVNPHVNRPAEKYPYACAEPPLFGVARMLDCIHEIQVQFPQLCVIGSGLSYLRRFSPQMAAAAIDSGYYKLAGYGRMAFAYPDFARDITQKAELDSKQVCLACGRCSLLMRSNSVAGCAVRDEVYRNIAKEVGV